MNASNIEVEIKKIKESDKYDGTYPIYYKGETRNEKVYEIPTSLLRFNYLNGRIGTEVIEFTQVNGTNLSKLSVDEVNEKIHKWIWEKTESDNKKTLKDIRDKKQIIPGVITRDGIIVDGNRRFMIARELNKEGLNRQFRAIILDDTYSDGGEKEYQIKRLEAEIQMGQDEKVSYGAIEPYIRVMDFVDNFIEVTSARMKYEELCTIMKIQNVNKVKTMYRIGKLMLEYLDYIGFDKMWSRLENTEDLFIKLENIHKLYSDGKGVAGWDIDNDDIENYKTYGFDLIRWNYNADPRQKGNWDSKKIRERYFKNSKDKAIFSNHKIWSDFIENLESIEDIEVPDLEEVVKKDCLSHADAAKKIDKIWAEKASNAFKSALGIADSKLRDKENDDKPEQFLRDALDKLLNLIDEDLFESTGKTEINQKLLLILQDENRIETNYKYIDKIRKIAETLKRDLK
ncbi:ParB N-terminal domain-containing protein [Flavobacterium collinsii]|uniref:ParB/Sulfiredoxin domain-containing protein n=1 Tax=Flavobacterium collinsii TaxID=1114861 RepID=A0A9W4TFJ1_9FLAO|nr:hypothetical protein [Flavobacterium collinsii]CAI2766323.1 conserved protein of unknown function [Flavobacterium collinsii]